MKEFFVVNEFVDICTGYLFLHMQVIKSCTIIWYDLIYMLNQTMGRTCLPDAE